MTATRAAGAAGESRQAWAWKIATILGQLPAPQGDVLRLLYFEHLMADEAADRLGISAGRVRSAAADGLRSLGRAH